MITIEKETVDLSNYAFTHFDFDEYKVIKNNDIIIGFIEYTIIDTLMGKCFFINALEVLDEYRDIGIGKAILNHIIKHYDIGFIQGVAIDDNKVISFFKSNNATFDKCIKCFKYKECDFRKNNKYCESPKDLKFYIFK